MKLNGYDCVNADKVNRAIYGAVTSNGRLSGGVGENASDDVKLAEYDKLGGLIQKDGNAIKIGSFYDFEKRCPREVPEVLFVFRDIEGNVVEVPEGKEVPLSVKAAKIASEAKKVKKVTKKRIDDEE